MGKTPICLVLCFLYIFLAKCKCEKSMITFTTEYPYFNQTDFDTLHVVEPATISNTALQLTPDTTSADSGFLLTYSSGRILLKRPFKLWEAATDTVASFNTSFLINLFRPTNESTGEGLAFVIAPDLLVPPNSLGPFLGLTNSWTDGRESNKLVAVEFDASKDFFDPDDNHVGIDVNSIISIKTENLTPHNITISPLNVRLYNVWLDYDGLNKVIQVYMTEQYGVRVETPPKPSSSILSADLNLKDHVNQHSYFGFSASTGNSSQLNSVVRWNLTVQYFPEEPKHKPFIQISLAIGMPILLVFMMCSAALGYYVHKRRMSALYANLEAALKCLPGMPHEFKFRDLKKATCNFSEKNKLGQGGFGVVYRGMLIKENIEVAVKWFSRESTKGQYDFLAELTIINRLRHKHLVKLLGWCHKNGKLLLVYEYMPNSSLDTHLFVGPNEEPLEWGLRYKIVSGLVSALHYLHNEYDQRVVHRDLKASNIMLDEHFGARLGDFGLARALDNDKTSYAEAEGLMGTMGYIAPECFLTGKATQQSDIYALGAVLLEVVCGRRPGTRIGNFQLLVDWVWWLHRDGRLLDSVDQRLDDNYIAVEAKKLLLLGLACSHPIASERPRAEEIVQIISGSVSAPFVPPFKPAFVWQATGTVDVDSSSVSATVTTSVLDSRLSAKHLGSEDRGGRTF